MVLQVAVCSKNVVRHKQRVGFEDSKSSTKHPDPWTEGSVLDEQLAKFGPTMTNLVYHLSLSAFSKVKLRAATSHGKKQCPSRILQSCKESNAGAHAPIPFSHQQENLNKGHIQY